jgi:hypothetical protein
MWRHAVLGLLPGGWAHPLCTHGAGDMPQCWAHPAHRLRLGSYLSAGHTMRTGGAWAACLWVGHPQAHTWRLGYAVKPWSRPNGDKGCFDHGYKLKRNGSGVRTHDQWSSVRTQFYWVLHQDSTFLGSRILNIIICFRNIIIFIMINIINKIIYKFERKYYYLSYRFLWYFL